MTPPVPAPDAGRLGVPVEHIGGCNPGCKGDDHLLISETPAGGHDSGAVIVSSPVEREVAAAPPAGRPVTPPIPAPDAGLGEVLRAHEALALPDGVMCRCNALALMDSDHAAHLAEQVAVWLAGQRETVAKAIYALTNPHGDWVMAPADQRILCRMEADAALAALGAGGA